MLAVDLHRILSNGLLFASDDTTLPMINCVRLQFGGGTVVATGTDRFTIGFSKAPCEGAEMKVLVSAKDAATVVKTAKTLKVAASTRRVIISQDGGMAAFAFSTGETIAVKTVDAQFPRVEHLLPEIDDIACGAAAFNPTYLGKFCKVISTQRNDPLHIAVGAAEKTTKITVGDAFVGLICPLRTGEQPLTERFDHSWITPATASVPLEQSA